MFAPKHFTKESQPSGILVRNGSLWISQLPSAVNTIPNVAKIKVRSSERPTHLTICHKYWQYRLLRYDKNGTENPLHCSILAWKETLPANAINKAYDREHDVHIFSRPEKLELLEYNLWEIKMSISETRSILIITYLG